MRRAARLLPLVALLAIGAAGRPICTNATGIDHGRFWMLWHDAGSGCLQLGSDERYRATWRLGPQHNLVAGAGWAAGRRDRAIRYQATTFEPGSNGYLSLYGWSTQPLVEYYVVQNWGGFVPPGPDAKLLGTVSSDGGTYRIYRTRRVDQPSIVGKASFDQYWSVRTSLAPIGTPATITFANHVAAWRRLGLPLGKLGYQIVATEGFGSTGRSDVAVVDR